jgi:hypothetical protein
MLRSQFQHSIGDSASLSDSEIYRSKNFAKPKGKAIPNLSLRFLFGKTLQCVVREEKPEEELMQFFVQSQMSG